MYSDILYIAGSADEAALREHIGALGLQILPERPGAPAGLSQKDIERNPRRLLSLKPISKVALDRKPFPHYSAAAAPLLEWKVSLMRDRLLLAGHIRHHPYMEKRGPDYRDIGQVFAEIDNWMKSNWTPMNHRDFIGQQASHLIAEGYSWSSFDPAKTTFVDIGGDDQEV